MTLDKVEAINVETINAWVAEASGGLLEARYERGAFGGIVIHRADGAVLDGEAVNGGWGMERGGHRITGVQFTTIYVPAYRRLDRRFRCTLTEIRNAVRRMLVRYIADTPDSAYAALGAFEHRNHLS